MVSTVAGFVETRFRNEKSSGNPTEETEDDDDGKQVGGRRSVGVLWSLTDSCVSASARLLRTFFTHK